MINKKHVFCFLFLFFINNLFSQTIICEYEFSHNLQILNDKIKGKDSIIYKNIKIESFNSIKFVLHHSNNKSIFFSNSNNLLLEDLDSTEDYPFKDSKISDFTSITFKDFKNKESLQREYILDRKFIINDSLHNYYWEIKNEIKNINGINCSLATTVDCFGNHLEAWYTLSIPISNGPSIYHGLPGLIVEIQTYDFVFKLTNLKIFKNEIDIKFDEKGKEINQSDFVKLFDKKVKNIINKE